MDYTDMLMHLKHCMQYLDEKSRFNKEERGYMHWVLECTYLEIQNLHKRNPEK